MNKITIHGRLTRDPETRTTQNGLIVANFSVAVDRRFPAPDGTKTDFFNCSAWQKTGEMIAQHFFKGKEILLTGEIQSRQYEAKDGTKRTAWEVNVQEFDYCGKKEESTQQSYDMPKGFEGATPENFEPPF